MSVVSYLDCGCAILSDGGREFCPTCANNLIQNGKSKEEMICIEERKRIGEWLDFNIMRTDNSVTKLWVLDDLVEALKRGELPEGGTMSDNKIEEADKPLSLTYPNGQPMLAVLAENQELPKYEGLISPATYHEAQQDMLKAGWRKCL